MDFPKHIVSLQTLKTLTKCRIMRHFISVFTVCGIQSEKSYEICSIYTVKQSEKSYEICSIYTVNIRKPTIVIYKFYAPLSMKKGYFPIPLISL